MGPLTRVVVALATTLVMVVAASVPAVVAAPRVEPLRATTVITGDSSAVMRVRLQRPATLDLSPVVNGRDRLRPAGVRIRGRELFPGFLLSKRSGPSASVMAFRTPHVMREGDAVTAIAGHGEVNGQPCRQCDLPAGDYDLYLLADAQGVRVSLTFDGITGRSRLTPRADVEVLAYQGPTTDASRSAISPVGGGRVGDGWLVGSYNVSMDAGVVPFAWVDVRACLEGGGEMQCREATLTGESDSIGGMHFAAHQTDDGRRESAVEWEPLVGDPAVTIDQAMLWVPLR